MIEKPTPPIARREPKRIEQLGRVRIDDYAWMKDDNWQEVMRDPSLLRADIRTHLEAENAYTKAMLVSTAALQEQLYQEMRGRVKEDDSSVPTPDGPWDYYRRFEAGAQHPLYVRKPRDQDGPEQVLLDVDAMAKGKAYYKVAAAAHSPDHTLIAYAVDEHGSEIFTIYVKDIATGEALSSPVTSSTGDFVWSPDSAYLFWTFRDDNGRPARIFRREARGADDVMIYDEPDEGFFLHLDVTAARDFILISGGNHEQTEHHFIPASDPTAAPILFAPREPDLVYAPTRWNDRWYILTNADGAIDFKIMSCPINLTDRDAWRDEIPHQAGRYILEMMPTRDYFVRLERVDALSRIVVRDAGGDEHIVGFDEQAYHLGLSEGYEFETANMRFVYDSPTTPPQTFDYDLKTRARTLRKAVEIPSGHDPAKYETHRLFAKAKDGADVPVTVLMQRGRKLDGSAPMLLYGYGSYGLTVDANFSIRRLSLVDRGWVYAIAHVRGGAEKGYGWFLDGRKEKKPNTFSDFIAAAEELIARGFSRAGAIVAEGASAGGLLMGAISNMRPDLWAGVIGAVPFVDVLNTMSDDTLPLTPPEWPEWGNPLEDPAAYDLIQSYSPYDRVGTQAYPAMLVTGGLTDPRVTYWEPAKWAAKLRASTTSNRPVLLKMIMSAGHAGSAGRFEHLREIAHDYAFALKAIGADEAGGGF